MAPRAARGLLKAYALISALLLIHTVQGAFHYSFYYDGVNLPFPWPGFRQFQSWYPESGHQFAKVSNYTCNETLAEYNRIYTASPRSADAKKLRSACYAHEGCIVDHLDTSVNINLQAATIIGGLMPTLLTSIGPSIAETSLLSTHRPLLSFLISIGAPAIYPTRVFEYADPAALLAQPPRRLQIAIKRSRYAIPISIMEYAIVCVCAANVIATGLEIGHRTILSWECTTTFAPLLWSLLAGFVHLVAATSFAVPRLLGKRKGKKQDRLLTAVNEPATLTPQLSATSSHASGATMSSKFSSSYAGFKKFCKREITICAHQKVDSEAILQETAPNISVALNVVAGVLGYIHVTFGILVFASLQFIAVSDITNLVLARYVTSSVFARLVLLFEIAGLRDNVQQDVEEKRRNSSTQSLEQIKV